jgi:hypothetical protein
MLMLSVFFSGWIFGYAWEAMEIFGVKMVAPEISGRISLGANRDHQQPNVGLILSTLAFGFTLGLLFSSYIIPRIYMLYMIGKP